jgi:2-dehydropantoate 2-reductase
MRKRTCRRAAGSREEAMRIAVIGVGAIGGLIAAKLAQAGEEVSVVARGAHLAAIRERGLRLVEAEGEIVARPRASNRIADLGPQDCVVLAVKAHQVADIAAEIPAALAPEATILTAQNGIPFWYFQKSGGPQEGRGLESVDPGGRIAAALPVERILGSVVYPAGEIAAPGVIRHIEGARFTLGELDGSATARVAALSEAFQRAGFKAPVTSDIRTEIWLKLWGNATLNPVSALTRATLSDILGFAPTRALIAEMMAEVKAVGEAHGIRFRLSIEKRIAGAEAIGAHKTSMLQDVEAGRAPEIEALTGSVIEMGRLAGLEVPRLEAAYAMVKLLARG